MRTGDWRGLGSRLRRLIWTRDLDTLPPYKARGIKLLRVAATVGADMAEGHLTLHAMGLVYTTLLALVPLLAVSFSVLKGFGVHNQIEPLLLNVLAPLGDKGVELTSRIVDFVDNMRVGVLGAVGLAFLLYTVISLVQKIERAFNHIWHVVQPRDIRERFTHYFSVILVGPLLVFAAIGITASALGSEAVRELTQAEPFGALFGFLSRLVPYLLVIIAFTFIYVFVPNTRVRLHAALAGGIVAAVLWQSAGWAFGSFVVTSTRYTAIYSSFAVLLLFMIWMYVGWLVLLIGASVAFYYQHPELLGVRRRRLELTPRASERLALLLMYLVGERHVQGEPPWTARALARRLGIPREPLAMILELLCDQGLLVRTHTNPPGYVPRRDIDRVTLKEVLDVARGRGRTRRQLSAQDLPPAPAVDRVLEEMESAVASTLADRTVGELVSGGEPAREPAARGGAGPQQPSSLARTSSKGAPHRG